MAAAALLAVGAGCTGPCPPVPVRLPSAPTSVPWVGPGYSSVELLLEDRAVVMVLDTGFPRTAISAGEAHGLEVRAASLFLGGAQAGPFSLQLLLSGAGGVLGSDVLHQLPLVLDARERSTRLLPEFEPPSSEPRLRLADSGRCEGGENDRCAPTLHLEVQVEGRNASFVLDTGAELTFVTTDLLASLSDRPVLEGVRISSGFAGVFAASAKRARTLSVGTASVPDAAVLASSELDAELARLSQVAQQGCGRTHPCDSPPRFGGFLGWNFLREFRVSLAEGTADGERRLGLERFAAQDHVRRDFVGVGVLTSPSADPPGRRIDGFVSVSPAREAGVAVGDIITHVDGRSASAAPGGLAPPGVTVQLTLRRGASTVVLPVTGADLLPNP